MKRVLVLLGVAMGVSLVGCGSDPREGLVSATLSDIKNATTKVANIKAKIDVAVTKAETADPPIPNFGDAEKEVDALKDVAKEMKEFKIKASALKKPTTEEQLALTERFRDPLRKAMEESARAKKELNERIVAVEKLHKDAFKNVKKKLDEADGEFEAISRH